MRARMHAFECHTWWVQPSQRRWSLVRPSPDGQVTMAALSPQHTSPQCRPSLAGVAAAQTRAVQRGFRGAGRRACACAARRGAELVRGAELACVSSWILELSVVACASRVPCTLYCIRAFGNEIHMCVLSTAPEMVRCRPARVFTAQAFDMLLLHGHRTITRYLNVGCGGGGEAPFLRCIKF